MVFNDDLTDCRINIEYILSNLLIEKGFSDIQVKSLFILCNEDFTLNGQFVLLPMLNNNPLIDCKEYLYRTDVKTLNDELYIKIAKSLCDKICKHFNISESKKSTNNKIYVVNKQPQLCPCCGANLQPPFNYCDFCNTNFI